MSFGIGLLELIILALVAVLVIGGGIFLFFYLMGDNKDDRGE